MKDWKPSLTSAQQEKMQVWINELRTTGFEQTRKRLVEVEVPEGKVTPSAFCCLGLLCHVLRPNLIWTPRVSFGYPIYGLIDAHGNFTPHHPTSEITDEIGATSVFVHVPEGLYKGRFCGNAANLNDNARLSFKEIADVLEWAYLGGPQPEYFEEGQSS